MANPEHLEVVRQGAGAIAEWRASHPDERLDLVGADLRRQHLDAADLTNADLSGADLRAASLRRVNLMASDLTEADLSQADLSGADLRAASLQKANLSQADLTEANLSQADLSGKDLRSADLNSADLSWAYLSGADLSGADLMFTNLVGADLKDANLASALLMDTIFGDTDLTGVKGLELVQYLGPSVIDESTLRRSWPLPEKFLRGCGLSNDLIAFYRATLGKAVEFYSCFISYSSNDQEFAERLHADLQNKGVRCWFAPEDLKIGDRIRPGIDEAIRLHDKLLLILSEHSVNSQWVEQEVETALAKERKAKERGEERTVLFPIRVDDSVNQIDGGWAALIRNTRHIGDFRQHDAYQEAFERLLRDLKAESSTDGGRD